MECLPTLYQQHICFDNADTSASATFGVKSIGTRHNKRSLSFGIYQYVVCAINKSYLLLALCGFLDVGCHLTSVMSEFNEKMRWYWRLLERTLINSLPACMYDKQSWAETDKTIHVLILKGGLHRRWINVSGDKAPVSDITAVEEIFISFSITKLSAKYFKHNCFTPSFCWVMKYCLFAYINL